MRRVGVSIVVTGIAACSLNLDGFSGGSSSKPDASADGKASTSTDGGTLPGDATVAPPSVGGGVIVAKTVTKWSAGGAQKHHVLFAQNLGAWMIFYESPTQPNHLLVKVTNDFVTFADGAVANLPKPNDDDGRNFDVAYANIAGADIFYVAYSTHPGNCFNYVLRGRMQGGTLLWSAAVSTGEADSTATTLNPDGPAAQVLPSGIALVSSGYNMVNKYPANFVVFSATSPDDGSATFAPGFDSGDGIEIDPQAVNARTILTASFGAVGVWERANGTTEPYPSDMGFAIEQNGSWSAAASVGFSMDKYDVNDWDAVTTADGKIHVARWTNGNHEHRFLQPDGTAVAGFAVPSEPHSAGDGLVLLDVGGTATMLAVGTDHMLRRTSLQGSTWAAWTTIGAADPARKHISGGSNGGPNAAGVVLWEIANPDGTSDLAAMKLP